MAIYGPKTLLPYWSRVDIPEKSRIGRVEELQFADAIWVYPIGYRKKIS